MAPTSPHYEFAPVGARTFADVQHPMCEGGVTVVAFQRRTFTPLVHRTTKKVTGAAHCATSGRWIPVLAWNAEVERAFRDLSKEVPLAPTSRTYTPRFWKLVGVMAVIVAVAAGAVTWLIRSELGPNDFQRAQERVAAVAAAPEAGDAIATPAAEPQGDAHVQWYVVREATPEAVTLQAYDTPLGDAYGTPDLAPERFTGGTLSVPAGAFLADGLLGTEAPAAVYNAIPADE